MAQRDDKIPITELTEDGLTPELLEKLVAQGFEWVDHLTDHTLAGFLPSQRNLILAAASQCLTRWQMSADECILMCTNLLDRLMEALSPDDRARTLYERWSDCIREYSTEEKIRSSMLQVDPKLARTRQGFNYLRGCSDIRKRAAYVYWSLRTEKEAAKSKLDLELDHENALPIKALMAYGPTIFPEHLEMLQAIGIESCNDLLIERDGEVFLQIDHGMRAMICEALDRLVVDLKLLYEEFTKELSVGLSTSMNQNELDAFLLKGLDADQARQFFSNRSLRISSDETTTKAFLCLSSVYARVARVKREKEEAREREEEEEEEEAREREKKKKEKKAQENKRKKVLRKVKAAMKNETEAKEAAARKEAIRKEAARMNEAAARKEEEARKEEAARRLKQQRFVVPEETF